MKCIKTRRVQLVPTQDFNDSYKYIRTLSNSLANMGNEIIRRHVMSFYEMDVFKEDKKDITKAVLLEHMKLKYGMSLQNMGYDVTKKYAEIPSNIRTTLNQNIYKKIKGSYWSMFIGKESIPSFRRENMAIPFSKVNAQIKKDGNDYYLNFFNGYIFKLFFGRDKSNNKVIIDRIYSNEYKPLTSNLIIKDKKIFLNLTYEFDSENDKPIDYNKVVGVDLGINRPITLGRDDGKYVPQIDVGGKVQITRLSIQRQRKALQKHLKYSIGGHGRGKKNKKLEDLRRYEHNFMKTINDNLSRGLINYCLSEGIGTIKLENLKGITKDTKNMFLKTWAYYQLQNMIEYKAKEHNIVVLYINPKYTSQTCPTCGNVDKEQRGVEDKTRFICNNVLCEDYGLLKDADIIAAVNISRRNVEYFEEKVLVTQ